MRTNQSAFFASLFLSRLADQILLFLVPLVVYQTTHETSWSGIAFFIEALPRYLVFPFCGVLCDRISPVRILRVSQLYRGFACIAGVLGYAIFAGIGWLVVLSACCGVLTSQGLVAREVLLPQVFKHQKFERVLSHSQLADQIGVVAGPVLAALMLGCWRWEFVVVATAILFFAADWATVLWQRTSDFELLAPEVARGPWSAPIKVALDHVARLPKLKKLVALAAAENLVIGVTLATSAAMVTGVHHQSDAFYALLQTAGAIATVVILLVIARIAIPRRVLGLLSFVAICAGGIVAGVSPSAWGYAIGFLLIAGFDKMFSIYIRTVRQTVIPPRDYGKTLGVVIMLNNLTQPLAGLLVGLFSGHNRVGLVIVSISLMMGGSGVLALAIEARRRHANKRLSTSPPKA